MTIRPVAGVGGTSGQGRRIVIERPPVAVDDVTDYIVEDDGLLRLWSHDRPAGDFGPGTYQAVYYAPSGQPQPDPLAQAG
jgi:hypothetical protein